LRKKVGIVFQFPESQLFEETVARDIAFGPKNFGVSEEAAKGLAQEYIQLVGLDESFLERSPFDLSGGQMRRVAIAGVLAMEPEVLV
ncbi:ATP-binding cassette domain-containing protein, partial [Enterococcus faecalis]|nr:ATP-binding cassette domain-containing protein [Enterococcus faecalis]